METKAYIESGILDLYAMGTLSAEEKAGVECMIASHPELRAEVELIQNSLNGYVGSFEKTPPAALRAKVLGAMDFSVKNLSATPVNDKPSHTEEEFSKQKTPSIGMHSIGENESTIHQKTVQRIGSVMQWGIAASFLVIAISAFFNYSLTSSLNSKRQQLAEANQIIRTLKDSTLANEQEIGLMAKDLQMMLLPGNIVIQLGGLPLSPNAGATVIWNKNTKNTSIALNKMPIQTAEKQYQLWAIVDGKPVDLGVLPQTFDEHSILNIKSVSEPQAFAITIEPKGGSIGPTMDQMIVVGNL